MQELYDEGFTLKDVRHICSISELKEEGQDRGVASVEVLKDLMRVGFTIRQLREGFSITDLRDAGEEVYEIGSITARRDGPDIVLVD